MSYYDYDPNYDYFYYEDDYPDVDVFLEDSPFEYYLPDMKNKRRKRAILAKTLDETGSDGNLPSRYLVPVVYAPTRVSDPNKLMDCEPFSENIDVYYSDSRNIEKEAKLFRKYAQPYYYASTIQEESESTASCIESCCMRRDMVEVSRDAPSSGKSNKKEVRVAETWQENGVKSHKLKKKVKCLHNANGTGKKHKKKIEIQRLDKPETSNSWTTLLSGSCVANRDTKPDIQSVRRDEENAGELPARKSKSWVCVSDKSKTSVKFNVKNDMSIRDVNRRSQSELQAVRDTDRVPDDEDMRNSICPSTSNVQAMAAATINNVPSDMVAWKNKSMKHDSSATDTSKMSCVQGMKSNLTIPDISETTDITINSGEYREFLDTINKIRPEAVPNQRITSHDKSMQNMNPNNNNNGATSKHKVMVKATESSETFLENMIRVKQAAEERQYLRRRVNPLVEVPLSISSRNMYIPAIAMSDFSTTREEEKTENRVISKKKSIFVKVFRTAADVIACCQNYAYKYVLRFILFI